MKRLLLVCLVAFTAYSVQAQQEPLHANYKFNYFVLNPAAAGMTGNWMLRASHRSDWIRIPGAPFTSSFSADGLLGQRVGMGINLVSDVLGAERRLGGQLAYSYHIPVGGYNLSLGLAGRLHSFEWDTDLIKTLEPNDPAVHEGKEWVGDLSFGAVFYDKKLYVGVSAPQIMQLTDKEIIELKMHIYGIVGYKFTVNNNLSIEPSALIKSTAAAPLQYDIGAKFHLLNEQLYFGAGYRADKFLSIMTGFQTKNRYYFNYSYDHNLGDFQKYSWGSHEVSIGLKIGKPKFDNLQ